MRLPCLSGSASTPQDTPFPVSQYPQNKAREVPAWKQRNKVPASPYQQSLYSHHSYSQGSIFGKRKMYKSYKII